MKRLWRLLLLTTAVCCAAEPQPWRRINTPSYRELRTNFPAPPPECAMTMWWFWNGAMAEADVRRDLDNLRAHGVRSVLIWAYRGLEIEYLSPTWFSRVRYAVDEAACRGMRVWLMDEGCYPSGFMGGRISRDFPELRMQVLLPGNPPQPAFRTPATRYVHTPNFAKDESNSLFDSLNPAATQVFLQGVHEKYREALGGRLGTTVLGIMGDEPSFPGVPWTAALPAQFERAKGYDVGPHLAELFAAAPTEQARRIRADYWDVWTGLYRDNFFKPQAEWCARHGMDYLVHLCAEGDMKKLLALNGDYFRCQRYVGMPGVDAIWRQVWPGITADFPKLASSAAHLNGRPRAFTEAYAVYGRGLSLEQAKWVMDHQFARGINQFQTMLYLSSNEGFRRYSQSPDWHTSPQWEHFALLAEYSNRASYLLTAGRPAAGIALYYPTTSGWLGDFEANRATLELARALLEHQRDFDFIDDNGLRSGVEAQPGRLRNRSGQPYRAVIVPPIFVISRAALDRLRALAESGGRVIFMGRKPQLIVDRSFRDAIPFDGDAKWASIFEALGPAALNALPEPDLAASPAANDLRYLHRTLGVADLYFLFNEGTENLTLTVRLRGSGAPEFWNAESGKVTAPDGWQAENGHVRLPIYLGPHESRFVVIGEGRQAPCEPSRAFRSAPVQGEWMLALNGRTFRTALRDWREIGEAGFSGGGIYTTTFSLLPAGRGKQAFIDLGEVRYSARVRVNGRDLGARAWPPFRWDITVALKPGRNALEIEVRNTAANELSGDPQRVREAQGKGWLVNSYFDIYSRFDAEMIPSGLAGPVHLMWR